MPRFSGLLLITLKGIGVGHLTGSHFLKWVKGKKDGGIKEKKKNKTHSLVLAGLELNVWSTLALRLRH